MDERRHWDSKYRASSEGPASRRREDDAEIVLRLIPRLRRGMMVLEAGSGTGRLSARLAEIGVTPVAVDFSEAAHGLAGERYPGRLLRVRADLGHLPFRRNSFHAAFSDSVLEHLSEPYRAVREAHRVVKPGGFFAATVPNGLRPDGWRLYALRFRPAYLLRSFMPWSFARLLSREGWAKLEVFGDILWLRRNWLPARGRAPRRVGDVARVSPVERGPSRLWKRIMKDRLRRHMPSWAWVNIGLVCVKRQKLRISDDAAQSPKEQTGNQDQ